MKTLVEHLSELLRKSDAFEIHVKLKHNMGQGGRWALRSVGEDYIEVEHADGDVRFIMVDAIESIRVFVL